jgi:hypothetical protein
MSGQFCDRAIAAMAILLVSHACQKTGAPPARPLASEIALTAAQCDARYPNVVDALAYARENKDRNVGGLGYLGPSQDEMKLQVAVNEALANTYNATDKIRSDAISVLRTQDLHGPAKLIRPVARQFYQLPYRHLTPVEKNELCKLAIRLRLPLPPVLPRQ